MVDADCDTLLCDTGKNPSFPKAKSVAAFPRTPSQVDNNPSCATTGADGSDTKPFHRGRCPQLGRKVPVPKAQLHHLFAHRRHQPRSHPDWQGTDHPVVPSALRSLTSLASCFLPPTTIQDSGKVLFQCAGGTVRLYKPISMARSHRRGSRASVASKQAAAATEIEIQQSKVTNLASAGIALSGSNTSTPSSIRLFSKPLAQNTDSAVMLNSNVNGVFVFNTIRGNGYSLNGLAGGLDPAARPFPTAKSPTAS